jgi:hypothetical protein
MGRTYKGEQYKAAIQNTLLEAQRCNIADEHDATTLEVNMT